MPRMKTIACIFAILALQILAACAVSANSLGDAEAWLPTKADAKRAVANNPRPPERLEPHTILPSLKNGSIGTIRRVRVADGRKVVALTFDLCELATSTTGCDMGILGFLAKNRVAATLFMGGKWMRSHAARVQQLMQHGDLFEIANHAWSHGNFALLDGLGMREQALWTQAQYELIRESIPESPQKNLSPAVPTLFRLPYGRCNEKALRALADMGFHVIQWDVVAESGSDNSNPAVAQKEAEKLVKKIMPGSIVLFHANLVPKGSAVLLEKTVALLKAEGFSFVTVSDLLRMGEAQIVTEGYFETPGDNLKLDEKFGSDGTGKRK